MAKKRVFYDFLKNSDLKKSKYHHRNFREIPFLKYIIVYINKLSCIG